jgi:hypothetical protein
LQWQEEIKEQEQLQLQEQLQKEIKEQEQLQLIVVR